MSNDIAYLNSRLVALRELCIVCVEAWKDTGDRSMLQEAIRKANEMIGIYYEISYMIPPNCPSGRGQQVTKAIEYYKDLLRFMESC
jgi:hypothetical protein